MNSGSSTPDAEPTPDSARCACRFTLTGRSAQIPCVKSQARSYAALLAELREISLLSSTSSILGWDEQTHLPRKAASFRGDQLSLLARLAHERLVSPKLGDLL